MKLFGKYRFIIMLLPLSAIILIENPGLITRAYAQKPLITDSSLHRPSQLSLILSTVPSSKMLDEKISKEIARGGKILKKWHDRIGLSRDEEANQVVITSSREDFIEQGFDYLTGGDQNILIPEQKWFIYGGCLSRIFDEGNTLLDTRNRIANGALNAASFDRKSDVLKRVRRYANQLEADDAMMTVYQSQFAEQKKKTTVNPQSPELRDNRSSQEKLKDGLDTAKKILDTGTSLLNFFEAADKVIKILKTNETYNR